MNLTSPTPSTWDHGWPTTISQCDGLTEAMSYWAFSDVFEEQGVVKTPFYGGFGLVAEDGIPKPALNAFAMLHQLGDRRLKADSDSALATRSSDGSDRHRALELRAALRHRRNLHSAPGKPRPCQTIHPQTDWRTRQMLRCKSGD